MTEPIEPTAEDWENYKLLETASALEIVQATKSLLARLQPLAEAGDKEAQLEVIRMIKYTPFHLAVAMARENRSGEAEPAPSADDIAFLQFEGISASTEESAEEIKQAYWRIALKHLPHAKDGYDEKERYERAVARLAELA